MSDRISRRDFLNGVALTIGAGLGTSCPRCDQEPDTGARPPVLGGGMRAGTAASFADAHALRDGRSYPVRSLPVEGEVDLVVVGAGISGLATAYFYLRRRPSARILILDNQDEPGGHARRCEMHVDGRLILGYGGSESIQSPAGMWSARALELLTDLAVDLRRFEAYFDRDLYPGLGLSRGVLFTREAFGTDRLVPGDPTRMIADDIPADKLNARAPDAFIGNFPLDAVARARLTRLYVDRDDVLPDMDAERKASYLSTISYRAFVKNHWGLDDNAANTFQKRSHDFFAIGIDGVPALDARAAGYPGFQGMELPTDSRAAAELTEPYIYHFPDGNASIARLLVRRLMPRVAPGSTMEDVVTAAFDGRRLDSAGAQVRLRLNSTVVSLGAASGGGIDVGYVHARELRRLRARRVVHAGYSSMLPFMTHELSPAQSNAMRACVKAPMAYVKVALRSWKPWVKAGVHEVTNPMGFFSRIKLDYPVSMGAYQFAKSPQEPIGLHLVHVPTPSAPDLDQRSAWRLGRAALLRLTFADFERKIFDELTRIVGPAGFVPERDIAAISVYRWGHGYAYGFNSLYDVQQTPQPYEVARERVGTLAIANSDAAWGAYAHCAIDEAGRAVDELVGS